MAANTEIRLGSQKGERYSVYGTPKVCTVSVFELDWTTIGCICIFILDLTIANNGSSLTTQISIPALPYKPIRYTSFIVGYCQAVWHLNNVQSEKMTSIGAAAYSNSNEIYFLAGYDGRTWILNQGELYSGGSLVVSGCFQYV